MAALVLGGASWNTMVYMDALPDGRAGTIADASKYETVGSTGTGKAFALRALGMDAILHAALGDDVEGARVLEECRKRGVEVIREIDPEGTPQHVNLMDPLGNRLSIFVNAGGGRIDVDGQRLRSALADAEVVFLNIVPSSLPVLPLLEHSPAPVWVDLHGWDGENEWHIPFIEKANVIQLSDEELGTNTDKVVADLLTRGVEMVILTKGSAGAEIYSGPDRTRIPAQPIQRLVDSNGAGDTFMVGLWKGLQDGLSIENAGALAAGLAAQTVQQPDLAPLSFT